MNIWHTQKYIFSESSQSSDSTGTCVNHIVILMQEGRNWHFGKNEFFIVIENTIKNTYYKLYPGSQIKIFTILWQKYDLKLEATKNKRNLSIKWLLLRNYKNADTTFLHSHDDMIQGGQIIQGGTLNIWSTMYLYNINTKPIRVIEDLV